MKAARIVLVLAATLASWPATSAAQDSRADIIAAAQAEKAASSRPYSPNKAEQIAGNMKKRLLDTPEGVYPWFDSVYGGGGFTGGAGYRRFIGDQTFFDTRGLLSAKGYKLAEVALGSMGQPRRLELSASAGWRDATQVAFYGVGNDTSQDARTKFRLQQGYAGAAAIWRAPSFAFAQLGVRYENYTLDESTSDNFPSVQTVFSSETAPGLGANPDYLRTSLTAGLDSRTPAPGYARRGGLYAVTWDMATDQDGGTYSFEILQGEVVQHVPVLRENWVLSFHGVAKTTVDDEDVVPYFLMPSLGSGSTLRAYPSWRFRDRHSLLMSAEWRWMPARLFLDAAIFYDAGKVASRRADLNFEGLQHNWGFGVRFHGLIATPLRIEIAHGREGFNLVFSGAAAF